MKVFKIARIVVVLMFFATIPLNSCKKAHGAEYKTPKSHKSEITMKYKKGDVIFLKPDSLKVVVEGYCPCSKNKYDVYYFDKEDHRVDMTVETEMIF